MTSPPTLHNSNPTGPAAVAPAPARLGSERLEALWAEQADKVYRTAYRIAGSAADAEDVVQTVFLRLARLPEERLRADAGGYLHRSAVNAALDVVRSRQRAGWVPLEPAAGGEQLPSGEVDPERAAWNSQLRRTLRLALARLSPRAAEMFALRYFEGLGNSEIADLMGISPGVVAVLLHRTRARLRNELVALLGDAS